MWNFCRKYDGAISVFLTLILIPTLLFGGVIIDGVRIYGSKNIISGAGELAMNGALANYDGSLNDAYGLIACASTEDELRENMLNYFEASLNANGLTTEDFNKALINLELVGESLNAYGVDGTQIWQTEVMKQEILEYMKYRAPVTFINRAVLDKLSGFEGIDKKKEAVDSQINFESELAELQEDFDELLELVDVHTNVYMNIGTNAQISAMMQRTKDNYERMCLLRIGYFRLTNCVEAIAGETYGLMKRFNDTAGNCSSGIDGFSALLEMEKLDSGMDDPDSVVDGYEKGTDEYIERAAELRLYYENLEMWGERIEEIYEEYRELCDGTWSEISKTYELAVQGCNSAAGIEEKMAEMKREMEKCRNLYEDWNAAISDMPDCDEKREMSDQASKYEAFFSRDNTDDFSQRISSNKEYYEQVKTDLEKMAFGGKRVAVTPPEGIIDPLAQGATSGIHTNEGLSTAAKTLCEGNGLYNWPYKLSTSSEKMDIESTDFVKYLREELCKGKESGDKGRSKEEADNWNSDIAEMIEEYKTLFLSDDVVDTNIYDLGELPSNWLTLVGTSGDASQSEITGNMSDKKGRKQASDSARNALNTNNSTLSVLSGLADAIQNGMEAVYMTEYVLGMFSYYTVNIDQDGNVIENPLSLSRDELKEHQIYRSEVEYVIWGAPNARDNVTRTKAMIFAIQFVCNAIFAFTNSTLKQDAAMIADLFPVGALGRAAIKAALLSVVALIETTQDLKQLTQEGEAVDLWKTKDNWETWILTRGHTGKPSHGATALRYDDYLWVLTCVQLLGKNTQPGVLARTADCIELNQTNGKEDADKSLHERYTMVFLSAEVTTETTFLQKAGSGSGQTGKRTYTIPYKGLLGY